MAIVHYNIDPHLMLDASRRRQDVEQTIKVLRAKVKAGKGTATDLHITTDPDQLEQLAKELREEVEELIKVYGHMVDRNL